MRYLMPGLKGLGHEVGQVAWWGLQGGAVNMAGYNIYPRYRGIWGEDMLNGYAHHFKADVVLTLCDIWPLPPNFSMTFEVPWIAWFPVDRRPLGRRTLARAREADYPVVYSKFALQEAREAGLECEYIPHGIDTDTFCPGDKAEARERLDWPADAYIATMVAANKGWPCRKAFCENLTAFKRFKDRHSEAWLYLHTQRTPQRRNQGVMLEELIEHLGIGDCVRFVNQVEQVIGIDDESMACIYRASDVLLAASRGEGFGLPIAEAQACGCPAITTKFSSMPELTVNGACTMPLQLAWTPQSNYWAIPDTEAIHQAMERLYRRDEVTRERDAERGVAFFQDNYDWDVVLDTYWKPFLEHVEQDLAKRTAPVLRMVSA